MTAHAEELGGDEAARGLEVFSARSVAQGLPAWTLDQVGPQARHRLYRATASEHFLLDANDERIPVQVGRGSDP
jgi:hypothetical protein